MLQQQPWQQYYIYSKIQLLIAKTKVFVCIQLLHEANFVLQIFFCRNINVINQIAYSSLVDSLCASQNISRNLYRFRHLVKILIFYYLATCYHQIGSINLTHCNHVFPWLCAWDVWYIIFVTCCTYISGKPELCFHYYCAVYDECIYSDTFWLGGRIRLFVYFTIQLS